MFSLSIKRNRGRVGKIKNLGYGDKLRGKERNPGERIKFYGWDQEKRNGTRMPKGIHGKNFNKRR